MSDPGDPSGDFLAKVQEDQFFFKFQFLIPITNNMTWKGEEKGKYVSFFQRIC